MIQTLHREEAAERMNRYGREQRPFLFIIDFEMERPIVLPLEDVNPQEIRYNINGRSNYLEGKGRFAEMPFFEKHPISKAAYAEAFQKVKGHLEAGNSYLTNLAFATPLSTNLSLRKIFMHSRAPYRLWLRGRFTVFSPETFVTIKNGRIASYPMKGTIDASLPGAAQLLLDNPKEKAEHATIVDLIRNDLSMVASQVRVARYRYLEEIATHQGGLLQSSSEIVGQLPGGYLRQLGDIIFRLLPAGSVSGAPKKKTVEIIREAEPEDRRYYTGVCGIFDGEQLDSGVMIRFIEQRADGLVFKSGGGITAQSRLSDEYAEMARKAYLPFFTGSEVLLR